MQYQWIDTFDIDSISTPALESIIRHICIRSVMYRVWNPCVLPDASQKIEQILKASRSELLHLYQKHCPNALSMSECTFAVYLYLRQKYPDDLVDIRVNMDDNRWDYSVYMLHKDKYIGFMNISIDLSKHQSVLSSRRLIEYINRGLHVPEHSDNPSILINNILSLLFIPKVRDHSGIYLTLVENPSDEIRDYGLFVTTTLSLLCNHNCKY